MKSTAFFLLWAAAAIVAGGAVTSLHQPFRAPDGPLLLATNGHKKEWRAVHVLSGACPCSRKVLEHLLLRGKLDGLREDVVLVDTPTEPSRDNGLAREGFSVRHVEAEEFVKEHGVRGVPLLTFLSREGKIAYAGGYSSSGDQDVQIWNQLRAGKTPTRMYPVLGCAVGKRLRREVDPFGLKDIAKVFANESFTAH